MDAVCHSMHAMSLNLSLGEFDIIGLATQFVSQFPYTYCMPEVMAVFDAWRPPVPLTRGELDSIQGYIEELMRFS
jgi:hypothetical protein